MTYTYRELLQALKELTEEELDLEVIVFDSENGQYLPVICTDKTDATECLGNGHPILII